MNQLDINVSRAIDGYAGGVYNPSDTIEINNVLEVDAVGSTDTNARAIKAQGKGNSEGIKAYGGSDSGTGVHGNGSGANGIGVYGSGSSMGVGVYGQGGGNGGAGVCGEGNGTGPGVVALGDGASPPTYGGQGLVAKGKNGSGIYAEGDTGSTGITAKGGDDSRGVYAIGGDSTLHVGYGVYAIAGDNGDNIGVYGLGKNGGAGVRGKGGSSGDGVYGWGVNGKGVRAKADAAAALHLVPQTQASVSTPEEGDFYFDSVAHQPYYFNGTTWQPF